MSEIRGKMESPFDKIGEEARISWLRTMMFRIFEPNDPDDQLKMGLAYFAGRHVKPNMEKAVSLISSSANQGNARAQCLIARGHQGRGELKEAEYWYRLAADQGEPMAETLLGLAYQSGDLGTIDRHEALGLLLRAGEKGYDLAHWFLGFTYRNGIGTDVDYERSLYWYGKAAESGYDAEYEIAQIYLDDKTELFDPHKGIELLTGPAEEGYTHYQYCLGAAYGFVESDMKDVEKSIYWFRKAAENGDEDAINLLKEMGFWEDKTEENE